MQMFPADAATEELIDYAAYNVWWLTIDETKFFLQLEEDGFGTGQNNI
jgi:hypothetical protein